MINILVVDDIQDNLDVMEMLIEEYLMNHDIEEAHLFLSQKPLETKEIVKTHEIDILFLDIMMPEIDGFEVLDQIRSDKTLKQPIIIMATALGDEHTKQKEEKLGANAYMVKPIRHTTIKIMFDRYIKTLTKKSLEISNTIKESDDFGFGFDFDDNFDNEIQVNEAVKSPIELIIANQSYLIPLSATHFLERYEWNIDGIHNQLEELNYLIFKMFDSLEHSTTDIEIDLENDFTDILEIIDEYLDFVSLFTELNDFRVILRHIKESLEFNDFRVLTVRKQNYLAILIKAIMQDLIEFKDKVFEDQNIENIYYLNASLASSCLDVENLFTIQ